MKASQLLLRIIIVFALASCDDTDIIPTSGHLKIVFETNSNTKAVKTGKVELANELVFTSGYITIREIVFDGVLDDGRSVSVSHGQVSEIDFATGIPSPEVNFEITPGIYKDVYIGIELQDINSIPTVVIEGTYTTSSNVTLPIRFEFNSGEVFDIVASSMVLGESKELVATVSFNPLIWFSTVTATELDNALLSGGVIIVSSTQNTNIFDKVADGLDVATEVIIN